MFLISLYFRCQSQMNIDMTFTLRGTGLKNLPKNVVSNVIMLRFLHRNNFLNN
jgi:hypothetical protein